MNRRRAAIGAAVGLAAVVALAVWWFSAAPPRGPIRASIVVSEALGGDTGGFSRALTPRAFAFPADAGPHPDFRTEWWYYTGNLETATGRHVGFQLTFFRTALAPRAIEVRRASAWATTQVYLAHFAVTDTEGRSFRAWSRTSREGIGLAGAQAQPFRVWLEDWSATADGDAAVRLRASEGDVGIDLVLGTRGRLVLQGDRGLSRKGPEPGNASYYYSMPRMPARGTVELDGVQHAVTGLVWMDREWSTSALGRDLIGWDWFALMLDDGRDLMVYRLRRRDGSPDPLSAGTLVSPDGRVERLGRDDVAIEVLDHWTSPQSRVRYPSRWRVDVPSAELHLEVSPRLPDQELDVGTRYWEGAVRAEGEVAGRSVTAKGYVELVGYGD